MFLILIYIFSSPDCLYSCNTPHYRHLIACLECTWAFANMQWQAKLQFATKNVSPYTGFNLGGRNKRHFVEILVYYKAKTIFFKFNVFRRKKKKVSLLKCEYL